ncbi:MAG: P-loop NTPase, partial [Nitrospinaceae bacterium]|nr:P-loop NTPase [Nitrospinaceae bacterium]
MTSQVNIIAVGGGKGGIGKSVVCTNLAIGIALSGQKVVLMDTDFGASNLHAMLAINNPV